MNVYGDLGVSAQLTATCESTFTYDATPSGGSDAAGVAYAWTFTGPGTRTPSSSTTKSGSVAVGICNAEYTGTVIVTDPRTDLVCTATAYATAWPFDPLVVSLSLNAAGAICPAITTDAVSYDANASGGNGSYSYTWNGPVCSGTSCAIDPSDATYCHAQTLSVTLNDSSGICPPVTSEEESYSKVTTVTASDN